MRREREEALATVASRQHQILTRRQLCNELRFSPASVDRLVRSGRLVPVRRGVYALGGCVPDMRGALYAGTAGSPCSVASHRSGSWLWRLPAGSQIVEIASARWHRHRGEMLCGFELCVHESLHLVDRDVVEVDGILRTRVARTLVDLGTSVALGQLDPALLTLSIQDAVRRNLTDITELEAVFARLAPDIRIGGQQFRDALDRFQPVLTSTDSPPEIKVGQALIGAGFEVVPQYELTLSPTWTVRLDFYLPKFHRAVEVSPFSTHGGALQREYDIARALRVKRLYGIEISDVGDEEIDRGCPELIAMLCTLRSAAA